MIIHRMPRDFIYRNQAGNANYTPPMQVGEHYALYEITFVRSPEGEFGMMQTVGLSVTLRKADGELINTEPHLCGAIVATGRDARFLHPETIMELVRHGYGLTLDATRWAEHSNPIYTIHDDPALLLCEPEGTA